jgi:hypothetical protein
MLFSVHNSFLESEDCKAKHLLRFGSRNMKRAEQNCQNRLRSPIIVDNMIKECIFNPNYYQAMLIRRTVNVIAKRKRTIRSTIIGKSLHRNPRIVQQGSYSTKIMWVNSGVPWWLEVPAPPVAPAMLILLKIRYHFDVC